MVKSQKEMGVFLNGFSLERISSFILDILNLREEPSTQVGNNLMEAGKMSQMLTQQRDSRRAH